MSLDRIWYGYTYLESTPVNPFGCLVFRRKSLHDAYPFPMFRISNKRFPATSDLLQVFSSTPSLLHHLSLLTQSRSYFVHVVLLRKAVTSPHNTRLLCACAGAFETPARRRSLRSFPVHSRSHDHVAAVTNHLTTESVGQDRGGHCNGYLRTETRWFDGGRR
jgi:hypothetical protein